MQQSKFDLVTNHQFDARDYIFNSAFRLPESGGRTFFLPCHHILIQLAMDFSHFNGAEQAHMTKVIEKRQVCCLIS